jgi:hypothetical protein
MAPPCRAASDATDGAEAASEEGRANAHGPQRRSRNPRRPRLVTISNQASGIPLVVHDGREGAPLTPGGPSSLIRASREVTMLGRSTPTLLVGALVLAACGSNPADIEELKKGQKDILARLDTLDKSIQQVKAAPPPRPQADPNKVYSIPIGDSPVRGPKTAKVTIAEFSDFQ